LSAGNLEDALVDSSVADHVAECRECSAFLESLREVKPALDQYRVLEPTAELIETVISRALVKGSAHLVPERTPVDPALFRVLLASLVSLPLVILINALMGWALYELAALLLPRTVALYCIGLFVVWASLAVSFGYASLPFLGALVRHSPGRLRAANP
jgi:hypothetical protein